jgi:hypothetical protein
MQPIRIERIAAHDEANGTTNGHAANGHTNGNGKARRSKSAAVAVASTNGESEVFVEVNGK